MYIGDTGRYPYGPKPHAEVAATPTSWPGAWSRTTTSRPSSWRCNTAAAAGLDDCAPTSRSPCSTSSSPAREALVEATAHWPDRCHRHGRHDRLGRLRPAVAEATRARGRRWSPRPVPGFVEFVEQGHTTGDEVTVLAERLLAPVRAADVDALLLGCTHYPYLARVIGDVMGPGVTLVSGRRDGVRRRAELLGGSGCCADRPAARRAPLPVERRHRPVRRSRRAACSAPSSPQRQLGPGG